MKLTREAIQRMISQKQGTTSTTIIEQGGGGGVTLGPLLTSLNAEAMPTSEGYLHWTGSAWDFTSIDLSSYATETWVQQQGYLTSSAISDMATKSWVDSQSFVTESAFSGMLEDEAYISSNGTIYIGNNSITPLVSSDISDMATKTWVNSNFVGKDATTGRLTDSLVFADFDYGIDFYDGNTYGGRLGMSQVGSSYSLTFGDGQNTKRVLLAGDADKNIPLYDRNGGWSGGITSMNGLSGHFRNVNAGVYELDYLPNGDVGVQNGKVLGLAELPGYDVIKANSNYNQDYNRIDGNIDPDDYSYEAYFKGLVRWAITEYLGVYKSDNSNITLIGSARPSSTGTVHIDLYGGFGRNPNADDPTLPMYCSGMYLTLTGTIFIFGTIEGAWYWRQINPASIDAASLGGVAAANYATQSWVNSQGHVASASELKNGNTTMASATSYGLDVNGIANANSFTIEKTDERFLIELYEHGVNSYHVQFWGDNGNDSSTPPDYYSFDSEVRATAFKKTGSSNDYVLLGGGGTKAVTDFVQNNADQIAAKTIGVLNSNNSNGVYIHWDGNGYLNIHGDTASPRGYIFDAPVTQSSDIRMKDVTDYLEPSVYDMASAPLVRFRWKNDAEGAEHVGTVAQYWQQVVPEAVVETAGGMLAMDYGVAGVVAGVTAARKIVELERRVKVLEDIIRHGMPALETEDEK